MIVNCDNDKWVFGLKILSTIIAKGTCNYTMECAIGIKIVFNSSALLNFGEYISQCIRLF